MTTTVRIRSNGTAVRSTGAAVVCCALAILLGPASGAVAAEAPRSDVVVVGSGISGLCAALEAARAGASVTVVDMASIFDGHAVMSTGMVCVVGTPEQQANQVVDSVELAQRDFVQFGEDAVQFVPLARKSLGAVAVDYSCRVVDGNRRSIRGLYAVGELTGVGGINGRAALEGTMLGPSILMGRTAAKEVVQGLTRPSRPASRLIEPATSTGQRTTDPNTVNPE